MKKLIPLLILCLLITVAPATECSAQRKKKDKIEMPQYPGGEAALHNYIKSELKYPHEANVNKESGEVIVGFSVGTSGDISAVRIIKSVSPSLDAEAIRVIKKMGPWMPGKKNGKPVRADMQIPINFKNAYKANSYIQEEIE